MPLPRSYLKHPGIQYPLLNYIPNIFETLLLGTIVLTVVLNSLVQLLVRGRVSHVLSGLGAGPGAQLYGKQPQETLYFYSNLCLHLIDDDDEANQLGFFQSLPFDEDFGVLLLRVGIASLEATGLRGWGNEVAPIQLPLRIRSRKRCGTPSGALGDPDGAQPRTTYGVVKMGRVGVGEVRYGSTTSPGSSGGSDRASTSTAFSFSRIGRTTSVGVFRDLTISGRSRRRRGEGPTQIRGLSNEVRTVDLGISEPSGLGSGGGGGPWWRWLRELGAFVAALWGVFKGMVMFLLDRARGRMSVRDEMAKGLHSSQGFDEGWRDGKGGDSASEEEGRRKERGLPTILER